MIDSLYMHVQKVRIIFTLNFYTEGKEINKKDIYIKKEW